MTIVFSDAAVEKFGENYRTRVQPEHGGSSQGGCMKAVYTGLGTLFGERYGFRGAFHQKFFREARRKEEAQGVPEGRFNTIDRVFRALEGENVTLPEQVYGPRNGKWIKDGSTEIDSLKQDLLDQIAGLPNGSHFFGVAVNGAIHSLILRFHKTDSDIRVFWMDQFSEGYTAVRPKAFVRTPDVTADLDDKIRSFGTNSTSVWPLNANKGIGVSIDLDMDGDGIDDFQGPAVEER